MISYNAAVWDYFGRSARQPGQTIRGEAGSREQGVWICFGVDVAGGRLENVGFRAFACPHIIAACQKVSEMLEGAPVGLLRDLAPEVLQREFDIPVEKAGKLLILKDAISACAAAAEHGQEE